MSSPSQLEQVISLDLCPELSVEQQQQQSALNATRQRWPYSQPVVCCALIDRPFELMTEGECIAIRASKFEWPLWEGENGCVRPPSEQSPDTPVCCFFTDRRYLRSVTQESYSECVSSGDEVLNAVPLTWCAAPKCVPGPAADNYENGFRNQDGEIWPSYGVNSRLSLRHASRLFMFTGVAVLLLVVLTCCFFTVVVLLRSIFGPRLSRNQRGPVPNNRSEVSFTTLDSMLADAELLPDVVNARSSPVDTSLPDVPEGSQGGTTDVVFVVMPDSTMHLGQGEENAAQEADTPAVSAALKPSMRSAAGSNGSEATAGELANETEHVFTMHDPNGAVSSGQGENTNPGELSAQELVETYFTSAGYNADEDAAMGVTETSRRESSSRNIQVEEAGVELSEVRQQATGGDKMPASTSAEGCEAAVATATPAAYASTSAVCVSSDESSVNSLQEELFCTGESNIRSDTPVDQCEQGID